MVSNIVGAASISTYDRSPSRVLSIVLRLDHADPSSVMSFWLRAGPSCSMPAIVVALL
jgi:hypothetical protein